MGRTKKRGPFTKEELLEIRRENQEKLDEIMSIPNYIEVIAKKYYGDDWLRALDNHRPEKQDRLKQNYLASRQKKTSPDYKKRIPATTLPIIQLTMDGEFVKEWETIIDWKETEGKEKSSYITPIQCAQNKAKSAYGFKWVFKKDYKQ